MQPSPKQYPGIVKQLKQIFGSRAYPAYEKNTDVIDQLWALCLEIFVKNASHDGKYYFQESVHADGKGAETS